MNNPSIQPIPVTILTGFLGSGKTTLLNRILTEKHGHRVAVIENEFGEVGVDNQLVIQADEEIFEMNNGCICCTVRGDLIRILGNLAKRRSRFDSVIIETTGLADPAPVAQTFFVDDTVQSNFRLDAIITLVDAKHLEQHLDDSNECSEQIAFADVVLINKSDLVSMEKLDDLEHQIRSMNASTTIHRTINANIPLETILDRYAFDLSSKLEIHPNFLAEEHPFEWAGVFLIEEGTANMTLDGGPDPSIRLMMSSTEGDIESAFPAAILLAHNNFSETAHPLTDGHTWDSQAQPLIELDVPKTGCDITVRCDASKPQVLFTQHKPDEFNLCIEQNGRLLSPSHQKTFAASHTHDNSVVSVGFIEERPVDMKRFDKWLSKLLQENGVNIFRTKGILNIAESNSRFVFQGVHMLVEAREDRPWHPNEPRVTRIIFIGRNLDRQLLTKGFHACLT